MNQIPTPISAIAAIMLTAIIAPLLLFFGFLFLPLLVFLLEDLPEAAPLEAELAEVLVLALVLVIYLETGSSEMFLPAFEALLVPGLLLVLRTAGALRNELFVFGPFFFIVYIPQDCLSFLHKIMPYRIKYNIRKTFKRKPARKASFFLIFLLYIFSVESFFRISYNVW